MTVGCCGWRKRASQPTHAYGAGGRQTQLSGSTPAPSGGSAADTADVRLMVTVTNFPTDFGFIKSGER